MYTIKGAAERVGISPSTLRAWERRYGVVTPQRTEAGYRVYSEEDVRALARMARLVDAGRPPSLAAQESRRQSAQASGGGDAVSSDLLSSDIDPTIDIEALVEAAAELDADRLEVVLDQMMARGSFEAVVDHILIPALEALGEGWASGRVSVGGEHLASNAVTRRLSAAYEAGTRLAAGPRVLVGMPPGGRHELGLFAFAVAARRHGLVTDYLGADLPLADWLAAAAAPEATAIVIAMPTEADVAATKEVLTALQAQRPDLIIAVGGAQQDLAPEGIIRLGHRIGAAAETLAGMARSR